MKLFNKKNKRVVEEDAIAAILNPETLTVNPEPSTAVELEKIIKTTDSMNIVSAIEGQDVTHPKKSKEELAGVREAIYRSFDLARRKIATEYEQIIVSGNFIDNPFLAVQISVKNFEKKWNVEYIESVVKKFTDAIPEQLSLGKTVMITSDLVIEPVIYVDKVLPSWKITPDFALLTNALKWQDIVNHLIEEGELSQDSKEIVAELVEAISINIKNGYYVKLARFVVVQVYPGSAQKILLFSNDTLKKMNDIYTRFLKTGERKQINKFDTVAHYERTQDAIKTEFLSQDAKIEAEESFAPKDLTEEITEEMEKQTDVEKHFKEEMEIIQKSKDVKLAQEETKESLKGEKVSSKKPVKEVKKSSIAVKKSKKTEELVEAAIKNAKPMVKKTAAPVAIKPVAKKPAAPVAIKPVAKKPAAPVAIKPAAKVAVKPVVKVASKPEPKAVSKPVAKKPVAKKKK